MPLVKRSDDPTRNDEKDKVEGAISEQEERMGLIVAAIDELTVGNDEHFTGNGTPRVEALEAAAGIIDITAKERDDAWETYNG